MNIRPAQPEDASAIARVHIDTWRTTYLTELSQEYLQGLSYEERTKQWEGHLDREDNYTIVAEYEGSEVVGFASTGPSRNPEWEYEGELYAIYILEQYQQQGLGKILFAQVLEHLEEQGFSSLLVWVLRSNPARWFYKSLAGKQVAKELEEIGGVEVKKVAYGWTDLAKLKTLL